MGSRTGGTSNKLWIHGNTGMQYREIAVGVRNN